LSVAAVSAEKDADLSSFSGGSVGGEAIGVIQVAILAT